MSETIADPIFDVSVPIAVLSKGDREYNAFVRLLPGLLATHRGKYVAVHDSQVVDCDDNDVALIRRVHADRVRGDLRWARFGGAARSRGSRTTASTVVPGMAHDRLPLRCAAP